MIAQEHRLVAISTPLGDEELVLYKAEIIEDLAQPFSINVEMLSENDNISLDDIIGQNVTLRLETADDARYFNGFVTEFHQLPNSDKYSRYGALIRPWFWLLTLSENCRIFQEKSYPDIIQEVFDELGFSDYEIKLTGSYDPQEYVVQFNESDFNFVTRLMEQEGIYYYFEHIDGKHTFMMADDSSILEDNGEVLFYQPEDTAKQKNIEGISLWENYRSIVTGGMRLSDFDFETPANDLESVSTDPKTASLSSLEKFSYPGKYKERSKGTDYTRLLMEKENVAYETKFAKSNLRSLFSGSHFTLTDHYREDQNSQYLITHYRCNLKSDEFLSNSNYDDSEVFTSEFTAIPSTAVYRPQITAMKRKMVGPQTAIVVGKAGEEIWTDSYGRVKVHFHWDRYGQSDEQSSCWIRVAQTWAGKNWGQIQIPRMGQEVLIEFLNGDPDRPIIVGSVYNGSTMPPYDLPANATQSGVKTRSTKGGSGANFNELRFEDKKGSEEVYIHAEKDQNNMVENDESTSVGNDRTETVGNNETITIGNDESVTIGANKTIEVGVNHNETIGADMNLTVECNKTETVKIASTEFVGAAKALTIIGGYQVSVGLAMNETVVGAKMQEIGALKFVKVIGSSSEDINVNKTVSAKGNLSESADIDVKITAGVDMHVSAEKNVNISAGEKMTLAAKDDFSIKGDKKGVIDLADELSIKCGKATIVMKKNGDIAINGKKLTVKGTDDIVMKGKNILQN